MKRVWKVLAVTAVAMVIAESPAALAEEAHFYAAGYGWLAGVDGDGSDGNTFDLDNTLGLSDGEVHTGFDLFARFGRHRVLAAWSGGEYDESDRVSGTLGFGGRTFGAGTVDSEVELTRQRLMYGFSFVTTSMLDSGVLVGSDGYEISTTLSQSGVGSEAQEIDSLAPAIGLNLGIRPPVLPFRFYFEAVFSSGDYSGTDTTLTDACAVFDWYIVPKLFGVQAGYRLYDLEAEDDGVVMDYSFAGPFAGLVFRL
jgi:hypothetical protein